MRFVTVYVCRVLRLWSRALCSGKDAPGISQGIPVNLRVGTLRTRAGGVCCRYGVDREVHIATSADHSQLASTIAVSDPQRRAARVQR